MFKMAANETVPPMNRALETARAEGGEQAVNDEFAELAADRTLLMLDDDKPFLTRLTRTMETRGFIVTAAGSVAEGLAAIADNAPAFAVIDMRLGDGNG